MADYVLSGGDGGGSGRDGGCGCGIGSPGDRGSVASALLNINSRVVNINNSLRSNAHLHSQARVDTHLL